MFDTILAFESAVVARVPPSERPQGRAAFRFCVVVALWGVPFLVAFVVLGQWLLAGSLAAAITGVGFLAPASLRVLGDVRVAAHLMAASLLQSLLIPSWLLSGVQSAALPWMLVCIVAVTFVGGRAAGVLWTLISAASVGGLLALQLAGFVPEPVVSPAVLWTLAATCQVGLFSIGLAFVWAAVSVNEANRQQLTRAREEADAGNRAKSAFLANMSHELRTPMNAVIGYAELMMDEAEGQDADDLARIRDAGRHLLDLVNDVLDLSKVEAGRMEFVVREVELGELVREVMDGAAPLLTSGANEHRIHVPDSLWVHADEKRLRQCLLNLVSNAAKFTRDGRIDVTAKAEGDRVHLTVRDTGIGIHADKLDTLFDPFTQASDPTSPDHGGTGLGLALVKEFAQRMDGKVSVSSTVGSGSAFTLELPRAGHTGV
jgi:signal transduction histidine kinase